MPKYEIVCKSENCDYYEETGWSTRFSELEVMLKKKCPKCKKGLEQGYGNRKYLMAKDKISTVSSKESQRREDKWHKKAKDKIHEGKVSEDAYYDMRDDEKKLKVT